MGSQKTVPPRSGQKWNVTVLVRSTRLSFGDALSDPDLDSRIERLNTESASRPARAFEAVAHGDADGVASNRCLELSATACGFAIPHVDYLSTRKMAFVVYCCANAQMATGVNVLANSEHPYLRAVASNQSLRVTPVGDA